MKPILILAAMAALAVSTAACDSTQQQASASPTLGAPPATAATAGAINQPAYFGRPATTVDQRTM